MGNRDHTSSIQNEMQYKDTKADTIYMTLTHLFLTNCGLSVYWSCCTVSILLICTYQNFFLYKFAFI